MRMVVVAAALLAATAFAADKEKIAVVELDSPPGMLGLSTQVTKAIISEAQRQKRGVIGPDELRDKLGNKTLNELMKCADQPACAADKLTVLGATKAVLGKLDRDEKNYLLKLYLVDLSNLSLVTQVDRAILIASRRFQKDVEAAVPGFLRGEREAQGTLTINATTQNAQVTINGEFMGVAPFTTQLKPGKYEVKVEKPKFLPVKRLVNVEVDQKTVEEFRMLLMPGEREDDVPALAGNGAVGSGTSSTTSGFSLSAPTWIFGVLTVASFGTGLAFGLLSQGLSSDLLKGYDEKTQVYTGTRAQALTAQTDALVANVLYGVSGAALIATVIFVVLDARAPAEPALEVAPTAAPGAGGFVLKGRF